MEYICIGKMINTFGIRGEIKIQSFSDFDDERYRKGNQVYILHEGNYIPLKVLTYRIHKGFPTVSFHGFQDINLIEKFKNCEIFVRAEDRKPLKKGEYYRSDLVGLTALSSEGEMLGKVTAVEETAGANNNLRICTDEGKEFLVPYVKAFIREVDTEKGTITVNAVEGLL